MRNKVKYAHFTDFLSFFQTIVELLQPEGAVAFPPKKEKDDA